MDGDVGFGMEFVGIWMNVGMECDLDWRLRHRMAHVPRGIVVLSNHLDGGRFDQALRRGASSRI